jgi:hypothetical protein
MPTYEFKDTKSGEHFEIFMTWSKREEYLKNNPHVEPVVVAPAIIGGLGSYQNKAPSGFNEVISRVAEAHPSSPLAEKVGGRSIKDVKTREIVKKHVDKITKRELAKK